MATWAPSWCWHLTSWLRPSFAMTIAYLGTGACRKERLVEYKVHINRIQTITLLSHQINTSMSSAATNIALPPVSTTLGVIQNSNSVSVFLFGVLTLQVYYYFEHHSGDGPYIKGLVSLSLSSSFIINHCFQTGVVW